jgi:oxygen-dependent protoporphyrinogen oxidase
VSPERVQSDILDVVIVGGGIAGLATAYELDRRGVGFRLIEQSDRPGGLILSERVGEFLIDAGPDALLVQKPAAIALCRELGLGDRLFPTLPPRTAYILRDGTLHPLPEGSVLGIPRDVRALATTRLFTVGGKARMAAEIFLPSRANAAGDESIASFIGRRFGAEIVTYLAEPLLAGIHAGDVDRLSMRALFPRFLEAERRHGSVLRAFRQVRQPPSKNGVFVSLPDGLGELVSALVRVLPAGALTFGSRVVAVHPGPPYTVETETGDAVRARAVIVTTPAFVAAELLRVLDPELARQAAAIPYASSTTVSFAWPRAAIANPLAGSGFVVPRVDGTTIMAGSWVSSKWPHRAPDGFVQMRAFIGGARDPAAMERSDADLVETARRELSALLGIHGDPIFARLYRWIRANAQHEVGHLDRIAAIEVRLAEWPGLFLTGSGFRGVGVPDCVADGRATAGATADHLASR